MEQPESRFFAGTEHEVEKSSGEDGYTALVEVDEDEYFVVAYTTGDICGGYVEFKIDIDGDFLVCAIGDEDGRFMFSIDPVRMHRKDILQITWELNYG